MKSFDTFLNACESIKYLDSVTKEGDTYTLIGCGKSLQIKERFDRGKREVLIWSKTMPDELRKVLGNDIVKVLPRLVIQHFTGLKNVTYTDHENHKHIFEDVGFFPVAVHNNMTRFSDASGRKWLCSVGGANASGAILSLYKHLYDGRAEMGAMMLPCLQPLDDVPVIKSGIGGKQVTVMELPTFPEPSTDFLVSSVDDLTRAMPSVDDMLMFPHQGDVPAYGHAVVSGMVVSSADRGFIASAERKVRSFLGSSSNIDGFPIVPPKDRHNYNLSLRDILTPDEWDVYLETGNIPDHASEYFNAKKKYPLTQSKESIVSSMSFSYDDLYDPAYAFSHDAINLQTLRGVAEIVADLNDVPVWEVWAELSKQLRTRIGAKLPLEVEGDMQKGMGFYRECKRTHNWEKCRPEFLDNPDALNWRSNEDVGEDPIIFLDSSTRRKPIKSGQRLGFNKPTDKIVSGQPIKSGGLQGFVDDYLGVDPDWDILSPSDALENLRGIDPKQLEAGEYFNEDVLSLVEAYKNTGLGASDSVQALIYDLGVSKNYATEVVNYCFSIDSSVNRNKKKYPLTQSKEV